MICNDCKNKKHDKCKGGTWCDCQHVEGVNRRVETK